MIKFVLVEETVGNNKYGIPELFEESQISSIETNGKFEFLIEKEAIGAIFFSNIKIYM